MRAQATFTDGTHLDVTDQATWSSDDAMIASVSNANGSRGQVTGVGNGHTAVKAQYGGFHGSSAVTVSAPVLQSLEVAPQTVTVQAGNSISLKALAHFSDTSVRDVSEQATWTTTTSSIASVSMQAGQRGKIRGLANGQTTVKAVFQGSTAIGAVTVSAPTLVQITFSPAVISTPVGITTYIEANAVYSDGTTMPVSDSLTWTSSNSAVAAVTQIQGYASIEAKLAGGSIITGSMPGGLSATCAVTVTNASITRVDVTPAQPSIPVGSVVELDATGVFSDLTTQYLRYSVAWSSSDPTVAGVGNSAGDYGVLTALNAGTTTITANFNGVIGTTVVTVNAATLQQIQVTPFAPHLPIGFDTYVRATGIYNDNTTRDLTYLVSWTTSAPAIASIGSAGYLQPLVGGAATLTATYQGVQGTTALTVTTAMLTAITIQTPTTTPLAIQASRPLTAQGQFSDGSSMDVTYYVTWLSSAVAIVNVNNAWPNQGEAKGLSAGSAIITAVRGSVTGALPIQVQ